jgi:thiosulfate/3-mercaptopyruvate sulfurtransferase
VAHADDNLHNNLDGYWNALDVRSGGTNHAALEEMFGNHCDSCHTSCGDCHVSQPASVGSGFVEGHVFNREPSMTRNCTACHGSRVGNEYMGKHEDIKADVHFRQGRMKCVDCHTGNEMHGYPQACDACHTAPENGVLPPPEHRYDGVQSPSCESCHAAVTTGNDEIQMHEFHAGELSCQVCHSVSYSSCDGCHVEVSETTGNPFFATEGSYLGFYIGKNPSKSFDRPYEYVPVRHIPVAPTSFQYYGENLLPDFKELPTWAYATPHNIQRNTPQTESCDQCHDNPAWFLTPDKVKPEELEANLNILVLDIPPAVIDLLKPITLPEPTPAITSTEVITP